MMPKSEVAKEQGESNSKRELSAASALVIVPTYNERENIAELLRRIREVGQPIDILVVDDSSPDGTGEAVAEAMKSNDRLFLLERKGGRGLGRAYQEGFGWALDRRYETIFAMDGDLSHDPQDLARLADGLKDHDLVVGSRYLKGSYGVSNWPLSRLLLSLFGNFYARRITGLPMRDTTSGFKAMRLSVLERVAPGDFSSDGYSFQIELHYRAWRAGLRTLEIPILFSDRAYGSSKMTWRVIEEAVRMPWKLRFSAWRPKAGHARASPVNQGKAVIRDKEA